MEFLKLTRIDGLLIAVNPLHVVSVHESKEVENTTEIIMSGENWANVQESVEDVLGQISKC